MQTPRGCRRGHKAAAMEALAAAMDIYGGTFDLLLGRSVVAKTVLYGGGSRRRAGYRRLAGAVRALGSLLRSRTSITFLPTEEANRAFHPSPPSGPPREIVRSADLTSRGSRADAKAAAGWWCRRGNICTPAPS